MEALIETRGLSYRYPRRGEVLSHVDFSLYSGDRVALTGPNGAGKTTFLHLLVGLKKAKSGDVFAFGKFRKQESEFVEVRAKAGFLFQDPDDQLFCPTVLEDVAFGPLNLGKTRERAFEKAKQTLRSLGMAGFEKRVAHQLSGGEKRLVALASVLAMEPEVLLLDEPTNALDNEARQRLLDVLMSLPQAMLVISHDEEFVSKIATRHIRLESARMIEIEAWSETEIA
ncbi:MULTISPECIES: energy-coupling factor ABC transporter ATP-binding protein [unclassified Oleiphilus]|uniref:energy-coupling factor ABC transporter ATP-binding protein n=3 Tax=Oleiphilus TaxID=141450 RepID=UPI0007C38AD2|nr:MULTISPECIES: ABC transporter ATP-binding protein [unclassified Oleiphilus]KZY76934.1 energy-coupling factor ABC transporter ATP-binding protein [Oleiphilus sp. HI0068]KZY77166.1 energy-coupling factor ABC transporter ATP-binding protein [Oleiphilus sp. HI0069]KZY95858.1 energy-coupling factor ABC transporter ATP-binding protein [Oleiphilus sp. HI0072]KZZ10924.1 energy-coupling factor ABC transporter ATP-binding protein [Oleiphilus sp. HI0078]KZZ19106.1 energy-coupling factor ABC transporte